MSARRKKVPPQLGLFDPRPQVLYPTRAGNPCPCETDTIVWACYALHAGSGTRCMRGADHTGDHMLCGYTHRVHVWPASASDADDSLYCKSLIDARRKKMKGA